MARVILVDPSPRAPFAGIRSPGGLLLACAGDAARAALAADGHDAGSIDAMPEAGRRGLWRRLLAGQGLPASLLADEAGLDRFLGVVAANLRAMVAARLAPLPAGPEVTVFTAARRPPGWGDALAEWETLLAGRATPMPVEADHWSILGAPDLARRIRALPR
ncbi:hypothetical protein [Methylobacterium sp. WSM2598]|uniref:hypothetical protein n=1 Tax=Methylobacterium sp. WSM2598 TaxID=398261 RepID=UPI0003622B22|nr:hypothetical protein [Methylobacterium sp. WSM2598]